MVTVAYGGHRQAIAGLDVQAETLSRFGKGWQSQHHNESQSDQGHGLDGSTVAYGGHRQAMAGLDVQAETMSAIGSVKKPRKLIRMLIVSDLISQLYRRAPSPAT